MGLIHCDFTVSVNAKQLPGPSPLSVACLKAKPQRYFLLHVWEQYILRPYRCWKQSLCHLLTPQSHRNIKTSANLLIMHDNWEASTSMGLMRLQRSSACTAWLHASLHNAFHLGHQKKTLRRLKHERSNTARLKTATSASDTAKLANLHWIQYIRPIHPCSRPLFCLPLNVNTDR